MNKYRLKTSGWWFDKERKTPYQECCILAESFEETEDAYISIKMIR